MFVVPAIILFGMLFGWLFKQKQHAAASQPSAEERATSTATQAQAKVNATVDDARLGMDAHRLVRRLANGRTLAPGSLERLPAPVRDYVRSLDTDALQRLAALPVPLLTATLRGQRVEPGVPTLAEMAARPASPIQMERSEIEAGAKALGFRFSSRRQARREANSSSRSSTSSRSPATSAYA